MIGLSLLMLKRFGLHLQTLKLIDLSLLMLKHFGLHLLMR
ncbi:hypothetical protein SORDD16_01843 [Streptococcus oralis]|uniref:Uncharacterized protein n=1 Tax=Streptococcus oralis TaxID=1303 RepID=A0A139P682_STROR|nr:hypothetical protein SORDD16_01843 [Streptococcus oralis]